MGVVVPSSGSERDIGRGVLMGVVVLAVWRVSAYCTPWWRGKNSESQLSSGILRDWGGRSWKWHPGKGVWSRYLVAAANLQQECVDRCQLNLGSNWRSSAAQSILYHLCCC
ncbi:Hypothetical predicted protein [Podarcis lilfordi]|uniref:Uncharacterized protein n=1 Tax=Podarcis lilfordi TaxID=74358 RepID=A0AA35KFG8_9SAUR|nr:Hypothetical predicted protein [Podarcis lilfordi]